MPQVFRPDHGVTIGFGTDKAIERFGADEFATDAYALTLRFFLNGRDGISIKQVGDLYQLLPLEDEEKCRLSEAFRQFEESLQEKIGIKVIDTELTRWMVVEVLLYGDLAHANDDKRPVFEDWRDPPQLYAMIQAEFEVAVAHISNFIFQLRGFNEMLLARFETFFN